MFKKLTLVLIGLVLLFTIGCGENESHDPEANGGSGTKVVTVYVQPGVTNADINGTPLESGQENVLYVDPDVSLVATYTYITRTGATARHTQDLGSYYTYHVIKSNGGWASTIHLSQFQDDKTAD